MPNANKTLGRDVKKPTSDEFERIERFAFRLAIGAVTIAQHDAPALVITEQFAFAEGRLLHIGCEITQGSASASRPLSLGHPRLLPGGGFNSRKDFGIIPCERLFHCLACGLRQCLLREEILFIARMCKFATAWSETDCRDQNMDVGMERASAGSRCVGSL